VVVDGLGAVMGGWDSVDHHIIIITRAVLVFPEFRAVLGA